MRAELSLTIMSLGGGVQSSVMALMASQSLPPTGSGEPSTACRTAPSSPTPAGSRPASTSTSSGSETGSQLPPLRRRQRQKPPRGLEGPHQPLGFTQLRGHTRLSQGTRRRGRRHRQAPVHRQLQDTAHTPKDTRDARTETPTARPRRDDRRAVAGHVHRRGHTHEDLPRPMDNQSLPAHREGDVQAGLRRLVDLPLRQTPGALCPFQSRHRWVETKRRWPELFAEAVEIDARLRTGWHSPKSRTCTPFGCLWPRRSPSTRRRWERTSRGTGSGMSARVTVGCERAMLTMERLGAYVDSCLSVHCCHQEDAMADQRQRRQ